MNKPKILIVEDQPILSRALQRVLSKLGYVVTGVVASGEEALSTVGGTVPDLVLMDIQLAGELDGVATAERLQA